MSLPRAGGWVSVLTLLVAACGGDAAKTGTDPTNVAELPREQPPPPPALDPAASAKGPGPTPVTAAEEERERAVLDLLEGKRPVDDLPVVATEGSAELDLGLRERLAPRGRAPQVRAGESTASPGLPIEVIRRIVRRHFGRFRLCYETALLTAPDLETSLALRFRIDPTGALQGASVSGSPADDAFRKCLSGAMTDLAFPQPEGGATVSVKMLLHFSPPL